MAPAARKQPCHKVVENLICYTNSSRHYIEMSSGPGMPGHVGRCEPWRGLLSPAAASQAGGASRVAAPVPPS